MKLFIGKQKREITCKATGETTQQTWNEASTTKIPTMFFDPKIV